LRTFLVIELCVFIVNSQPVSDAGSTVSAGRRRVRSLWDFDWLSTTVKRSPAGTASTELAGRRTTDPGPGTLDGGARSTGARQPPLRLILIRAVGTENIWSSRPAHQQPSTSDPPQPQPQPRSFSSSRNPTSNHR